MSDFNLTPGVPSTPNPAAVTLVAALLRSILMGLAGAGVAVGSYNDTTLLTVAGILVGIGTAVWSLLQKYHAKEQDHMGNEMSAEQHKPVQPA